MNILGQLTEQAMILGNTQNDSFDAENLDKDYCFGFSWKLKSQEQIFFHLYFVEPGETFKARETAN